MLYHIRAELADGTYQDFRVAGSANDDEKISAAKDARTRTDEMLRKEFGPDARLEWRGMVVFVDRNVPLS